jgi:hypothetical protein
MLGIFREIDMEIPQNQNPQRKVMQCHIVISLLEIFPKELKSIP